MARPFLLLVTAVVAAMACGESRNPNAIPLQPSATPSATPGAAPNATPIVVGQTVGGTVYASDPPCDTHFLTDAPDPCQRFVITPSVSGKLRVHVSSPGPDWLALRVGSNRSYGVTTVEGATDVTAGLTLELSVALHTGGTSQAFELSTTMETSS